jgi:SPX domain protein involved in polyphosphate accumulation
MTTDDWSHVHVKLDPEMKDNWEEYVEQDKELSTVSALVRTSVQKEIDGDYDDAEAKYDEVIESLTNVETQVNQVSTTLQMLRTENVEQTEMEQMLETVISRMESLSGASDIEG